MGQFREWMFRKWYWYVNTVDKKAEILFMNYGYSNGEELMLNSKGDKENRYSIQLYHLLADAIDMSNRHILEIGSGRGGGLAYISREFKPQSATGMDLDSTAVSFSNQYHASDKLKFVQGDAQQIPMENNSYDVIMNVESSHRYPDMKKFLSEVTRVLRPGGYFLFTDFRYDYEITALNEELRLSGMNLLKEEDITMQVVRALELDDSRKIRLVKKLTPKLLHKVALNFAGTVGSTTYKQFLNRELIYKNYVFQKN